MDRYPFNSIFCNGREIEFRDILNKTALPASPFEASIFSFAQQWFHGAETFLQNTSGSTGVPKPILVTREEMIASSQLTARALHLNPGTTALVCLDPEYIAGKMMLVRSFVTGMKIVAINPSTNPFLEISKEIHVDFTALVPSQLYQILKSEEAGRLNFIKNILVGGAAISHEIKTLLSNYEANVHATYGMTETISHIALQALNGPHASEYFTVLPGIKIEADDRGCLLIDVPFLKEKIITNDLVEIKNSFEFKWVGRVDNIINSGGVKVIPEKIEEQINALFVRLGIRNNFLITGVPDNTLGYKVILLIEGHISDISLATMKMELRVILPRYEVPKEIYENVKFIYTKNGKINRSETARQVGN